MGGGLDRQALLGLIKAGSPPGWFEQGWMGLGEESVTLTDIQYTQLKPPTGSSNIIIRAGRSHIYYPICPTGGGGGGKYQHSRQHGSGQEFQNRYIWEPAGTLGDRNGSVLIIELVCLRHG